MRRICVRTACLLVVCGLFASVSHGYYHFLRYSSRNAPWRVLPEKFDVNALPGKTLTYIIGDYSQVQLSSRDSYTGLISQIRAAADTWNSVESSDLRLGFGGQTNPSITHSAPQLEILFEEVPPGLVAQGGFTVRGDANGSFVPIVRSIVRVRPDLTNLATYSESFFGTLVHEFGHALGLQHSLASGVMATGWTRSTSKAKPLSADDIAGISLLYPTPGYLASTGSISGRVTQLSGAGVGLASVVAISPNGAAVNTLTHPDGSYKIEGLQPRNYYVYVHPLPPALPGEIAHAGLNYPTDLDGRLLTPGGPFETVFYRGLGPPTKDVSSAFALGVVAGGATEGIDFAVRSAPEVTIHSVEALAYLANFAVKPPHLTASMTRPYVILTGSGLTAGNGPAPGLTASVLGGSTLNVRSFSSAPAEYVRLDFDVRTLAFSSDAPRHLVLSLNNQIYVRPSGFFHVDRHPPSILRASAGPQGSQSSVVVSGTNFTPNTRILFDGVPAAVRSFDESLSQLTVIPPAAAAGHRATLVALNPDGQSSLFVQSEPPAYVYPADQAPVLPSAVGLNVAGVNAGSELLIEVNAPGMNFAEGQVALGFGTSDVAVRRLWVLSPTLLAANIWVHPQAQVGPAQMTVVSGLQTITAGNAFNVLPANPSVISFQSSQSNFVTGRSSVSPGSLVTLTGTLPPSLSASSALLFLNDRPVPIAAIGNGQMTFAIPPGTPEGLGTVRIEAGSEKGLPIGIHIDPPPSRVALSSTIKETED